MIRILIIIVSLCFPSNLAMGSLSVEEIKAGSLLIKLKNLNPKIGSWYLLEIENSKSKRQRSYHLEVPSDRNHKISLHPYGIIIDQSLCPLWKNLKFNLLTVDFKSHLDPYYPICEGKIFLRLPKPSQTQLSTIESVSVLIRKRLSFGEKLINFFKPYFVKFSAEIGESAFASSSKQPIDPSGPANALVAYGKQKIPFAAKHHLGMKLNQHYDQLAYGMWYPTQMHQGIYVSMMLPGWISPRIKSSFPDRVHPLTADESNKMVYLVAYDLDLYHVDYINGLKEPGIPSQMTDAKKLVSVGNIPIYRRDQTVGVFIGGFKREHGIITRGPHRGKRYGYVQNGITLEPLNPGLATFFSTRQHIEIAAWSPNAHASEHIVSARQNGVPLIERLEPTPLVKNWAWGHWSGDAKGNLQSLRSAICIQKHKSKRFLIFAAFTAATPSSMAKTLQAYRCENALHLDMNAYMYVHNALIDFKSPDKVQVEYLHQEMEYPKGLKNHRFILDNNERDFFYVYRKPSIDKNLK